MNLLCHVVAVMLVFRPTWYASALMGFALWSRDTILAGGAN